MVAQNRQDIRIAQCPDETGIERMQRQCAAPLAVTPWPESGKRWTQPGLDNSPLARQMAFERDAAVRRAAKAAAKARGHRWYCSQVPVLARSCSHDTP